MSSSRSTAGQLVMYSLLTADVSNNTEISSNVIQLTESLVSYSLDDDNDKC